VARAFKPIRCIYCGQADQVSRYDSDGRARCDACGRSWDEFQEARYLFHMIWTRSALANVAGGYLKAEFNQLRELLDL